VGGLQPEERGSGARRDEAAATGAVCAPIFKIVDIRHLANEANVPAAEITKRARAGFVRGPAHVLKRPQAARPAS
jgi:hypothetical protein